MAVAPAWNVAGSCVANAFISYESYSDAAFPVRPTLGISGEIAACFPPPLQPLHSQSLTMLYFFHSLEHPVNFNIL